MLHRVAALVRAQLSFIQLRQGQISTENPAQMISFFKFFSILAISQQCFFNDYRFKQAQLRQFCSHSLWHTCNHCQDRAIVVERRLNRPWFWTSKVPVIMIYCHLHHQTWLRTSKVPAHYVLHLSDSNSEKWLLFILIVHNVIIIIIIINIKINHEPSNFKSSYATHCSFQSFR